MAIQLLFYKVLLPGFVQNSMQHPCIIPIYRFLQVFHSSPCGATYKYIDMATSWKNSYFILSERSDFYMVYNLLAAVHALPMHILTLLSVDETLLPHYMNGFTNFRCLPYNVEMTPLTLKYINSVLSEFT